MKKTLLLSVSFLALFFSPLLASASQYVAQSDDDQNSGYEWPSNDDVNVDETDFDDPTYDNNDSDEGSVEVPSDENEGSSDTTSEDEE